MHALQDVCSPPHSPPTSSTRTSSTRSSSAASTSTDARSASTLGANAMAVIQLHAAVGLLPQSSGPPPDDPGGDGGGGFLPSPEYGLSEFCSDDMYTPLRSCATGQARGDEDDDAAGCDEYGCACLHTAGDADINLILLMTLIYEEHRQKESQH